MSVSTEESERYDVDKFEDEREFCYECGARCPDNRCEGCNEVICAKCTVEDAAMCERCDLEILWDDMPSCAESARRFLERAISHISAHEMYGYCERRAIAQLRVAQYETYFRNQAKGRC